MNLRPDVCCAGCASGVMTVADPVKVAVVLPSYTLLSPVIPVTVMGAGVMLADSMIGPLIE